MTFSNGTARVGVDVVRIPTSNSLQTNGAQYIDARVLPYLLAAAALFFARTKVPLWIEEGYRSYSTQASIFRARYTRLSRWQSGAVYWDGSYWLKRAGQATAAVPGTSVHGLGLAIDAWSGIDTSFSSARHLVWVAVATALGWQNTGTAFGEPWHQEWALARVTNTIEEEDDMTKAEYDALLKAVKDAKNEASQAGDRALKALNEVEKLTDPITGVGRMVWAFVLANKSSASKTLRDVWAKR